jgi:ribonuclease-3
MNPYQQLRGRVDDIEDRLGYQFSDRELLLNALVHRSYVNEHRDLPLPPNERLEFLGDSVLGLVVADYLFHRLPSHSEGQLSQLRSKLVDAAACAKYLQKLRLAEFLLLGRGEQMTEGRSKGSILADAFEAIVGAIYLDGGIAMARSFLLCHFEGEINEAVGSPPRNFKAELQDYSQKKFQVAPVYRVVKESGPEHAKQFHVIVCVQEQELGIGVGTTKKEAEQRAALEALMKLGKHD